ncbi:Gldg family protein, partial [Treponema sp. R6D11]
FEQSAAGTKGKKDLGAALTGEFPSFFKGSEKPVREGSDEVLPDMPQYAKQSRILVVGDTDFATNMINATNARQNLDFLLRCADWLVSDEDIIKIRSEQPHVGRLDKIFASGSRAAAMRFVQIINVGVIPLLVVAVGLILASRRKKRSQDTEKV